MKTFKNFVFLYFVFFLACGNADEKDNIDILLSKDNVTSGENLVISYDKQSIIFDYVESYLIDGNNNTIDFYGKQNITGTYRINRILNSSVTNLDQLFFIKMNFYNNDISQTYNIPINIDNSLIIETICSTNNCESISGNIIEEVPNKVKVSVVGIRAIKYYYYISYLENVESFEHSYNTPTNFDYLENIIMPKVSDDISSYVISIRVVAEDIDGNYVESAIPIRVVRPLEVKHYGKYELAEVYEPIPVSGCIVGGIGNNVSYSESTSETRQNSLNIVISKSWSDSNSKGINTNQTEGISIGETSSVLNSSSMSNSETNSESQSYSNSNSENYNTSYSTSDGENWSWSINESSSQGSSNSNGSSTSLGGSGSVTTGVSGEGSLPFLAKASGKVETSVGVNINNTNSENNTESVSNSNGRSYTTVGIKNKSASYGTSQNTSNSSSLSGSYAISSSNSNSISEGNSNSSTRVWNMNTGVSQNKVVTTGDSESISETIVESSSSSTTFSYSTFIPRGRKGIFYRQTSRWTKLSEIITYDLDGIPNHAGYISMNTWRWAPELAIGDSCIDIPRPQMESASCYIPPCGE